METSNNQLATTQETKGQLIVKQLSQTKLSQLILAKEFSEASKLLPTTIRNVFDQPKIHEQVRAIGEYAVRMQLKFELNVLADLINTGGNLNATQIDFIAESLMEMFPNESIADFKLCFKRGAMGLFGPIQRLDGVTIGEWMRNYLEEKYGILESLHRKQEIKQDEEEPKKEEAKPADEATANKYMEMLKEQTENAVGTKKVREMSDRELKFWGSENPIASEYEPDLSVDNAKMREAITKAGRAFYQKNHSFDTSKFSTHQIGEFTIYAASVKDASEIYDTAYKKVFGK